MSRREAWLSVLLVFLIAVAVRVWAASLITFPRPEDTAYYVGVARNLLEGRGLVSDAIWSYATPPLSFPRSAFEVWLPLPTFLAAIPMALLGTTFAAAQWSSIVVGGIVAVLAWRLAADVAAERQLPIGRARTLALGVGLSAAVFLPLVLHSVLPDSTMPFAALVLGTCLLAARVVRDNRGARATDPRVLAIGVLLGLAALTRNEAVWLALAWVVVARGAAKGAANIGGPSAARAAWFRLVAGAAIPAILVFLPWAIRDWAEFGSPFPGQAITNALSLDGRDIFAWQETPTLDRYLDAGLGTLIGLRVTAFVHNIVNVLLLLGIPISAIGLVALPWTVRGTALSMLAWFSGVTFVATTLLFPVATTWGTFLHAAAAVQVLLLLSALLALDRLIVEVGRRRGWTRPVAWLGPTLAIAAGVLFTGVLLPTFGRDGDSTRERLEALPVALAAAGVPLEVRGAPVITDVPIYLAYVTGSHALALPDEPPDSVVDLARHFPGTHLLIVDEANAGIWPEIGGNAPLAARVPVCFRRLDLSGSDPALDGVVVFLMHCPRLLVP
jgi:hypothetical protein